MNYEVLLHEQTPLWYLPAPFEENAPNVSNYFSALLLCKTTVLYTEALASINWKGDLFWSKVNAKTKLQSLGF